MDFIISFFEVDFIKVVWNDFVPVDSEKEQIPFLVFYQILLNLF